jgi:hypothetical protein
MHRLANGIYILNAALALAYGEQPNVTATKNEPCTVIELFPKTPGIFKGIANEDKLRALPSLHYFDIKPHPGDFVGKSSDGYKMCAVVILHHKDYAQFIEDKAFLDHNVWVITQPDSSETA